MTLTLRRFATTPHGGGIHTAFADKLVIGSVIEEIGAGGTSWRWPSRPIRSACSSAPSSFR